MGKSLLFTMSIAVGLSFFSLGSKAANTLSDWGKCMVANDGRNAPAVCGPEPGAEQPTETQAPASNSAPVTTTTTTKADPILDGNLGKLDGRVNNCTSVCTVDNACDANCVSACQACNNTCDQNCNKLGLTNFTCPAPKKADADPPKKSVNGGELAQACINDNSSAVESCLSSVSNASNKCNVENNSALGTAISGASALALGLGSYTGSSVQAACSDMGKLSEGSNAAVAAYSAACSSGQSSCSSSCSSAKSKVDSCADKADDSGEAKKALASLDDYKALKTSVSQCSALKNKVDQAGQAMQNMAQTMKMAQNCATATNGLASAAAADCTNPTFAATNQVCICQANPRSPGCPGGEMGSSSAANMGIGGIGDGSTAMPTNVDLPGLTPDTNLQELKASLAGEDVGGKKGNGAAVGGPGAFDGAGGARGAGKPEDIPKYGSSGFYGGSASGGGSGSGGGSPGSRGYAVGKEAAAKAGGPDLRQFLPGGKNDPSRGIAGATGPDGITGPNTNIWEKIQNRYRTQTPSLY